MTTNAQDAPTFRTEADLIAFLDSLHATTETGAATSEKWEPAQRAIRALRAGGEAVAIKTKRVIVDYNYNGDPVFADVPADDLPSELPSDDELPGMWSRADLIGGETDANPSPPAAQPERAVGGERRVLLADHPASRHALLTAALNTPPAPAGDAVAGLVEAARSIFDETVEDDEFSTKGLDRLRAALAALQSSGREGMVPDDVALAGAFRRVLADPSVSWRSRTGAWAFIQQVAIEAANLAAAQETNRD